MIESYWNEEWREIPFEKGALRKRYAVSNYGRVISYCSDGFSDASIVKGGTLKGYKTLPLRPFGKSSTFYVHKLVAQQFIEKSQDDQTFVIHLDYNKCNNFVENLRWANKKDMFEHQQGNPCVLEGREKMKGRKPCEGAKLTDTQVMLLKRRISDPRRKTRLKIIARQFGISEIQLHRIKRGENWAHIQEQKAPAVGEK